METPRFSITVPAFNAQATLAETIGSVRSQSFRDWELVIVDDGSTDGTRELAESLAADDSRIRVVSQENRGSGGAYNTAVRNSTSDLIVMLSADDLLAPDHLAEFDGFISAHPEASVFTCDGWYEYADGAREPADPATRWASPEGATLEDLLLACFYGVGAVYRRAVFDAVGGFREGIYAEDYLFWLLALSKGYQHRHLPRRLSVHRRNETQKSADAISMRETDVHVLTEVIESGALNPAQLSAARASVERHKRNIRIRKALAAVLGQDLSSRVVDKMRDKSGSRGASHE